MAQTVDLILFMGQSNMAGRAIVTAEHPEHAPFITPGAGWEFRPITDPKKLYPIMEPFGVNEQKVGGILEVTQKTGSLVTAFANAYYEECGVPMLAVSAARGGSSILEWQPGCDYLNDTVERIEAAKAFAKAQDLEIAHICFAWCQGETDADNHMTTADYDMYFDRMYDVLKEHGVEVCFMVTIGHYNDPAEPDRYTYMIAHQKEMATTRDDMVLCSSIFEQMRERGLMKDAYHYFQQAYNECGTEAGKRAGTYRRLVAGRIG